VPLHDGNEIDTPPSSLMIVTQQWSTVGDVASA
jgi:hypothetical protein